MYMCEVTYVLKICDATVYSYYKGSNCGDWALESYYDGILLYVAETGPVYACRAVARLAQYAQTVCSENM